MTLLAQTQPIIQELASKPLLLVLIGFGGAVLLFAFMPQIGNFILGIFGKKIVDVTTPTQELHAALSARMFSLSQQPGFDDPATEIGKQYAALAGAAASTNAALPIGGIFTNLLSNPMLLILLVGGAFLLMSSGQGCNMGCNKTPTPKPAAVQE